MYCQPISPLTLMPVVFISVPPAGVRPVERTVADWERSHPGSNIFLFSFSINLIPKPNKVIEVVDESILPE